MVTTGFPSLYRTIVIRGTFPSQCRVDKPLQYVTPILARGCLKLGNKQYSRQTLVPTVCCSEWSEEPLQDVTPVLAGRGARGAATNWGQLTTAPHSKSLELKKILYTGDRYTPIEKKTKFNFFGEKMVAPFLRYYGRFSNNQQTFF